MPNEARWCGWLLFAGLLLFMVGAVRWNLRYQATRLEDALQTIARESGRWMWIHAWMAAGVLTTVAGLALWMDVQRSLGECIVTPIGFYEFLIGAVLWLTALVLRVTVADWAARETVIREVPSAYPPFHAANAVLHASHMVLAYVAAALFGVGVLRAGVLPGAVGWVGIACGVSFAVGFVVRGRSHFGFLGAPFLALVYPFALGMCLLRSNAW
jgi:hypothetical protein